MQLSPPTPIKQQARQRQGPSARSRYGTGTARAGRPKLAPELTSHYAFDVPGLPGLYVYVPSLLRLGVPARPSTVILWDGLDNSDDML